MQNAELKKLVFSFCILHSDFCILLLHSDFCIAPASHPAKEDLMSKPETRIQELHLTLPTAPKPVAKYKTAVLVGNILYVSGHGPAKISDKTPLAGKVGADLNTEQGKECARAVGLNILSTVRA